MNDTIKPSLELNAAERLLAGADAVRCFRLITFVSQRLRYLLDQRLREADLTTQQGFLLTIVGAKQRPSLGEVAEVMSTTHQNVKQIAIALERKGMLHIVTDESDGRVRRLDRTAVQDPDPPPGLPVSGDQTSANRGMHLGNVVA